MKALQDKIAVVTGGNSGIGYATAAAFKDQGARVVITGRRKEALEAAARKLGVHAIVAVETVRTNQLGRCMSQVQVAVPVAESGSPSAIDQISSRTCRVASPVPGCSERPVSS